MTNTKQRTKTLFHSHRRSSLLFLLAFTFMLLSTCLHAIQIPTNHPSTMPSKSTTIQEHPSTLLQSNHLRPIRDRKHRMNDIWDILIQYLNKLKNKKKNSQPSIKSPKIIKEETLLADHQLKNFQIARWLKSDLQTTRKSSLETSQACQKCLNACIQEKRGPVCYGNCASKPFCRFEDISLAPNLFNHD
ncbi:hypothetical protein FDP41_001574 [Naegleria fowleri]|uniref:Apple domain-containing protein n=1 Tax=Naegleria fowleri TaxID=5763 RepID=A0A6A5BXJ9_NAEFO|nr:uncharacterized protein FDP41_001574 [Naegleria fowleri]KAF0979231.1 hypothetical protein FDP41_001574 [Naegleria fowleri]